MVHHERTAMTDDVFRQQTRDFGSPVVEIEIVPMSFCKRVWPAIVVLPQHGFLKLNGHPGNNPGVRGKLAGIHPNMAVMIVVLIYLIEHAVKHY